MKHEASSKPVEKMTARELFDYMWERAVLDSDDDYYRTISKAIAKPKGMSARRFYDLTEQLLDLQMLEGYDDYWGLYSD